MRRGGSTSETDERSDNNDDKDDDDDNDNQEISFIIRILEKITMKVL